MQNVSRRRLLGLGASGGSAALAAVVIGKGLKPGAAEAHGGHLTVEVVPDLSSFDTIRGVAPGDAVPTGSFYVEGSIYPNGTLDASGDPGGASPIGTFRCWGWIFDGSTGLGAVSQAYELDGRGDIQVQGLEDDTRAVVGGTGDFRNVRGEGSFQTINPANLTFRAFFSLLGSPH